MIVLLILTNIATAVWAIVYYVRFHWADSELDVAMRALENVSRQLATPHRPPCVKNRANFLHVNPTCEKSLHVHHKDSQGITKSHHKGDDNETD